MRMINVTGIYVYDNERVVKYTSDQSLSEAELYNNLAIALTHNENMNQAIANMKELLGLPK